MSPTVSNIDSDTRLYKATIIKKCIFTNQLTGREGVKENSDWQRKYKSDPVSYGLSAFHVCMYIFFLKLN